MSSPTLETASAGRQHVLRREGLEFPVVPDVTFNFCDQQRLCHLIDIEKSKNENENVYKEIFKFSNANCPLFLGRGKTSS